MLASLVIVHCQSRHSENCKSGNSLDSEIRQQKATTARKQQKAQPSIFSIHPSEAASLVHLSAFHSSGGGRGNPSISWEEQALIWGVYGW